ncbi:xyloside xylosyltransferase 1 isoform X2 [Emydura macquarii macquarii]|uniref:xyloside xylosyltransferase 1 isoform X2 n=1 Tax=Emydura macquarii macquarii TaxID=1129001 RepID=UPI00352AD5FC
MARLGAARPPPCALLLAAGLALVCAFYYLGSGRETFSSATRRLRATRAPPGPGPGPQSPSARPPPAQPEPGPEPGPGPAADFHLLLMFTRAAGSPALQARARLAIGSLLRHARFAPGQALRLHFVSEPRSREIAQGLLRPLLPGLAFRCQVIFHDVNELTEKLFPIVEAMQKHFSAGLGAYYSDSIFFLSEAMHLIMPKEIERLIQVDLDLKYKTNIRELFEEFDNFPPGAVIGIAREMQPVYSFSVTCAAGLPAAVGTGAWAAWRTACAAPRTPGREAGRVGLMEALCSVQQQSDLLPAGREQTGGEEQSV